MYSKKNKYQVLNIVKEYKFLDQGIMVFSSLTTKLKTSTLDNDSLPTLIKCFSPSILNSRICASNAQFISMAPN